MKPISSPFTQDQARRTAEFSVRMEGQSVSPYAIEMSNKLRSGDINYDEYVRSIVAFHSGELELGISDP